VTSPPSRAFPLRVKCEVLPNASRQMRLLTAGVIATRIATCLLVALALSRDVEASPVDGTWRIRNLALNIFDCQRLVCGQIVWIDDPTRRPSQCGMIIIWGLEARGRNEWDGGSILDPNDGKTYRLSAVYEQDGTLRARIFKGVPLFGKTEILKRVDLHSLTGLC
jgi:uncharacterized protein (DUF2147 family)